MALLLDRTGALETSLRFRRRTPWSTLAIVTFHRVDLPTPNAPFDPDVIDSTPEQFRHHVETLARVGTVIDLKTLMAVLHGEPLPPNPIMITFDDGYRSCRDVALPILREVGVPATFFISTGFPDSNRVYWWERVAWCLGHAARPVGELTYPYPITVDSTHPQARKFLDDVVKNTPNLDIERFLAELGEELCSPWSAELEAELARSLIMSWKDIRALVDAGMDIGSHGRWHRVLDTLDDIELEEELTGSRRDLERQLGRPIRSIAYPVGRPASRRVRTEVARAGYEVAFTNATGLNHLWPPPISWLRPFDPYAVSRLSCERSYSDAMFLTQIALPALSY